MHILAWEVSTSYTNSTQGSDCICTLHNTDSYTERLWYNKIQVGAAFGEKMSTVLSN